MQKIQLALVVVLLFLFGMNFRLPTSEATPAGTTRPSTRIHRASMAPVLRSFQPCNAGSLRNWRPGKCSDDKSWLVPWMKSRPAGSWRMVDVGANKGYVIAEWLEILLGEGRTVFTPHNLGVQIYSRHRNEGGFMSKCGGCCECVGGTTRATAEERASSVQVWAFEPGVANYRWLRSFFMNASLVNVTNAAVSYAPGTAYFPDTLLGVETGKVKEQPAEGYVPVQIVSLDSFFPAEVDFLDVLSTDAEGFDQDVAKGATRFIAQGRVGVYQFEMYRAEDYKSIFRSLEFSGFACYFFTEARGRARAAAFVRITHGCWNDVYANWTGWVNGLCYNTRIEVLGVIFDRLEKTMKTGGSGNCPSRVKQRKLVTDFVEKFVNKTP